MELELITLLVSITTLAVLSVTGQVIWRQTKISQQQTARSHQMALIQMAQAKPQLRSVHGEEDKPFSQWELDSYRNLWIMHLQLQFLTRSLNRQGLRTALSKNGYFSNEAGRQWWLSVEPIYSGQASTLRHKQFVKIAAEEHKIWMSSVSDDVAGSDELQ